MNLPATEPIPLSVDDTGSVRVTGSRITLDVISDYWRDGATPEQIVEALPTLHLPDVYAIVAWMLRHPDEVGEYLSRREQEADEIQRRIEALCPPDGLRARLMARMRSKSPN